MHGAKHIKNTKYYYCVCVRVCVFVCLCLCLALVIRQANLIFSAQHYIFICSIRLAVSDFFFYINSNAARFSEKKKSWIWNV